MSLTRHRAAAVKTNTIMKLRELPTDICLASIAGAQREIERLKGSNKPAHVKKYEITKLSLEIIKYQFIVRKNGHESLLDKKVPEFMSVFDWRDYCERLAMEVVGKNMGIEIFKAQAMSETSFTREEKQWMQDIYKQALRDQTYRFMMKIPFVRETECMEYQRLMGYHVTRERVKAVSSIAEVLL